MASETSAPASVAGMWGEVTTALTNHTMAAERRQTLNWAHLCSSTEKFKEKNGSRRRKLRHTFSIRAVKGLMIPL